MTTTSKRNPVSIRLDDWTKRTLELRCRASGRTLSGEIDILLQQRLREDRPIPAAWTLAYGGPSAAVLFLAGEIMREQGEWLDDPRGYAAVAEGIEQLLALVAPPDAPARRTGWPIPQVLRQLLERYFGATLRPAWQLTAQVLHHALGSRSERLAAALATAEKERRHG